MLFVCLFFLEYSTKSESKWIWYNSFVSLNKKYKFSNKTPRGVQSKLSLNLKKLLVLKMCCLNLCSFIVCLLNQATALKWFAWICPWTDFWPVQHVRCSIAIRFSSISSMLKKENCVWIKSKPNYKWLCLLCLSMQ